MTTGFIRKEQEREVRKQDILNIAAKMFAMKDFHSVTMDDIAAEVGLSKGTIYLYFETKENLFYSILIDRTQKLLDILGHSLNESVPFVKALHEFVLTFNEYFQNHEAFFKLMHSEKTRSSMEAHYKLHDYANEIAGHFMGILSKLLEKGVSENILRSQDIHSMAKMLAGMLNTFTFYRIFTDEQCTPGKDSEIIVDLFLNGIRKPD